MMTVLIVADDDVAASLRPLVQDGPHFRVISHASGPVQALAQARALLPDIVLIDSAAPGAGQGLATLFQGVRGLQPPSGVIWHLSSNPPVAAACLEEVDGCVHVVRRGDQAALRAALVDIGRRRASCDPDQPA
ncbi:hypothetical protein ABZS76_18110 [Streptomyces sp. NPDC005562]|uniref:hypothetical protein n=1 Tax=Streptomyces sp. NPDC005562 TaxID=3154890 RepID=UPI0033BD65DF